MVRLILALYPGLFRIIGIVLIAMAGAIAGYVIGELSGYRQGLGGNWELISRGF